MKNESPITKSNRRFRNFNQSENQVWNLLCDLRLPTVREHVHPWWLEGWDTLNFTTDQVPDFNQTREILRHHTNWELISTDIKYTDDHEWFLLLKQRQFVITEYIRDKKDLDYTPLPDIFHDAFGHLPFQVIPEYAELINAFGDSYINANETKRRWIINNWWYTVEFGFIKHQGDLKVFGTGLISSKGELEYALSDHVHKLPYDPELVGIVNKSPHAMHKLLFVIDDFEELLNEVRSW